MTQSDSAPVTLHVHHWSGAPVTFAAVVGELGAAIEGAVVLAYSPEECVVGCIRGGRFVDGAGRDLTDDLRFFEIRAFNPERELRWRSDPYDASATTACILGEDAALPGPAWAATNPSVDLRPLPNQYLLWGKSEKADPAWTTLVEPRIGSLVVPLPSTAKGKRLVLRTVEYLGVEALPLGLDRHGNTVVVEERLCGLSEYDCPACDGRGEEE